MGSKDPLHTAVSTRIRRLLQLTGHTQKALAPVLDGDPSIITNRLNGRANITIDDLGKIAKFLDVEPTVFLMTDDEFTDWVFRRHPEWIAGQTGAARSDSSVSRWILTIDPKRVRRPGPKELRLVVGEASTEAAIVHFADFGRNTTDSPELEHAVA